MGTKIDFEDFEKIKKTMNAKRRMAAPISTGSMVPVIPAGSIIEVVPLEGSPQKFDIIVFWDSTRLICHYVEHVNALPSFEGHPVYVTRGLASKHEDLPVEARNVLGKVVSHRLSNWARLRLSLQAWFARFRRGFSQP